MLRIVLDTNIWISGLLLPKSSAGQVLLAWKQRRFTIVNSEPILAEIEQVLAYPKIQKRLQWTTSQIEEYVRLIKLFTEVSSIDHINVTVEKDINDTAILATLIASRADYLVSGDSDLLCLKSTYPIITLAEFYTLIK